MDTFERHEALEIEVLEKMNSGKFLEPLVFGGGTMLRLCYELNRYSVDLDFWFVKTTDTKIYFAGLKEHLSRWYELTDACMKHYTILLELRAKGYPKRLKIEIRKEVKKCDFDERIAFSTFSTKQVVLKAMSLEQMMKNKIEAVLSRHEIRDLYDIEFMLRKGVPIGASRQDLEKMLNISNEFKKNDFSVTLGSLVKRDIRAYYMANKFTYLQGKIASLKT